MNRSKKMVLVAHCLLNTNAKVQGLSLTRGVAPIVNDLILEGYGLIQLPCIEMAMFGSRRWGIVREQCSFQEFRSKCISQLTPIVNHVQDYIQNGYDIVGVIGVDGSPTCGVHRTVSGEWGGELCGDHNYQHTISTAHAIDGNGVMMQELKKLFSDREIEVPFYAIDEEDMSSCKDVMDKIKRSVE